MAVSISPNELISSIDNIENIMLSLIAAAGAGELTKKTLRRYKLKLIFSAFKAEAKRLFHKKSEGTAHAAMMTTLIVLGVIGVLVLIGLMISWMLAIALFLAILLVSFILDKRDMLRLKKEEMKKKAS